MDKLVYVETSVPSFYFDTRLGHDMQAMRQWTHEWWSLSKLGQELVIGAPVLVELGEAPARKRDKALALIKDLRLLPYTDEVTEIVEAYIWACILSKRTKFGTHGDTLAACLRFL